MIFHHYPAIITDRLSRGKSWFLGSQFDRKSSLWKQAENIGIKKTGPGMETDR